MSERAAPAADASVREAGVNDAPAVGHVQAAVWQQAYAGLLPPEVLAACEPRAFATGWRASLAAPPPGLHRLLVACAGQQVVGMLALGPSQDPDGEPLTGQVSVLGVHPEARRQGHGSRLLNAAVDVLREAGADELTVWVPATDEHTRAFLVSAGFQPDGAYRDRVVSPDGEMTLREVRLVVGLGTEASPGPGAADTTSGPGGG